MKTIKAILFAMSLLLAWPAPPSLAQGAKPGGGASTGPAAVKKGGSRYRASGRGFFYVIDSRQDSASVEQGSAAITRFDLQYLWPQYNFAAGLLSGYDRYGSDQQDVSLAPTLELTYTHLFFEVGYGLIRQQFENRAVVSRNGTLLTALFGTRDRIWFNWLTYDVGVEWRHQRLTQENGRDLHAPIISNELMPMMGFGISL